MLTHEDIQNITFQHIERRLSNLEKSVLNIAIHLGYRIETEKILDLDEKS